MNDLLKNHKKQWLITGCAGFIGSHICEHLLLGNQSVVGLDNFLTGKRENIDHFLSRLSSEQKMRFKFIEGDINSVDIVKEALTNVDIVIHQAALGSVPRSMKFPLDTHYHNASGFLNLLNCAKNAGIKRFVYASSSSVYGDSVELPKIESKTGQLLSPYAATKHFNEIYAGIFQRQFQVTTVGLRYFNVFGPRQDPEGPYAAVIPKWISLLLNGEDVEIYGDGTTSRDFCYVENVVQANIRAALAPAEKVQGQVFNIACGQKTSLNELYENIASALVSAKHLKTKAKPTYKDFRAGDIAHSLANIDKAKNLLGYNPRYKVKEGLEKALAWYLDTSKKATKKKVAA